MKGDNKMNCPNCGRELAEGEVCNCTQNQSYAPTYQPPVDNNTYQQPIDNNAYNQNYQDQQNAQYYNPAPDNNQGYYVDPNQPPYYVPNIQPKPSTDYPEDYKPKKKYVAVLLGYTLGIFGIHNFYLGNNGKGLAQVLIATIGAFLFGLGPVVTLIWSLIETVLILVDKNDADANNYKLMTLAEEIARENKKANKE